jgi:hypothetical protein
MKHENSKNDFRRKCQCSKNAPQCPRSDSPLLGNTAPGSYHPLRMREGRCISPIRCSSSRTHARKRTVHKRSANRHLRTVRARSVRKCEYSVSEFSKKISVQYERVQQENICTVRTSSVRKYQCSKSEFSEKISV